MSRWNEASYYSYYIVLYNRSIVTFVKILKRNNIHNSECVTHNSLYMDMDLSCCVCICKTLYLNMQISSIKRFNGQFKKYKFSRVMTMSTWRHVHTVSCARTLKISPLAWRGEVRRGGKGSGTERGSGRYGTVRYGS